MIFNMLRHTVFF